MYYQLQFSDQVLIVWWRLHIVWMEFLIDSERPTLITGDFNVCYNQHRDNAITNVLQRLGFVQLVEKATHIMGGLIDHAYWRNESDIWEYPSIERFSPYYSDHDAILITLKKNCDHSKI